MQKAQVLLPDLTQGQQPGIEDTQVLVTQGRSNTTTGGVAAKDNVLDAQMTDGEFDHRRRTQVGRVQDVGDVPVDEDVSRLQAQNGGLRASGVGAADPEDFGALADRQGSEQVRILLGSFGSPFLVRVQSSGQPI